MEAKDGTASATTERIRAREPKFASTVEAVKETYAQGARPFGTSSSAACRPHNDFALGVDEQEHGGMPNLVNAPNLPRQTLPAEVHEYGCVNISSPRPASAWTYPLEADLESNPKLLAGQSHNNHAVWRVLAGWVLATPLGPPPLRLPLPCVSTHARPVHAGEPLSGAPLVMDEVDRPESLRRHERATQEVLPDTQVS